MWIRKLQRMGASMVLTVPRDVMRRWEKAGTRYVEIRLLEEGLVVRPLSAEQLLHRPAPEEEELDPHGG